MSEEQLASPAIWSAWARAPSTSNCLLFFTSLQSRTNSDIGLCIEYCADCKWLPRQKEYPGFVTVYCMNFIIVLCVPVKQFSLSFVPHIAPNTGDATAKEKGAICKTCADGLPRSDV